MPSQAEILRKACEANGLGTSGSAATLLARLVSSSKKSKSAAPKSKSAKPHDPTKKKKSKSDVKTAKRGISKGTPIKSVKGGGKRMSASYYFHEMCDGKISRCTPQKILQPNGQMRLKEVRIVDGAHGRHPRWVNVSAA